MFSSELRGRMLRKIFLAASLVFGTIPPAIAQVANFTPVTREMLLHPSPDDWLMFSRTYDNQRFSPLNQVNRGNVWSGREEWGLECTNISRWLTAGSCM